MSDGEASATEVARSKNPKKSEALWLMSFSDMSLVLLCFFVLMISTMKPAKEKFKNIKEGLESNQPQSRQKSDSLKNIGEALKNLVKQKKLDGAAEVTHTSEGLHLEFKDGLVFEAGSAKLNKKTLNTVREVLSVIARVNALYQVNIEGHTDDAPFRGAKFNNWQLSASRGFSLMRQLNLMGIPENRLSVTALAHTKPKTPYQGLKGRALKRARASNRRVVIWIE